MNLKLIQSFVRNYFRFENSYFTVGSWKKELNYFLKMGNIYHHTIDRIKFRIFPKLLIVPSFPSHLDIESASACQMRCPMCYTTYMADELKGVMDWSLYTSIVDQASKLGVYSIKLSWRGEPLLNGNFVEMVKYAKEKGIKEVAALTNAEFLDKKTAEALVDSGLSWLSISADGVGKIYNEIRAPAIFEETLDRVKYMKDYRDKKGLIRPLLRAQSIMSAVENDPELFYEAWDGVVDRINIIADEIRDFNAKGLMFDEYFVCSKPWQRMSVAYDGQIHQCISDYGGKNIMGDAKKDSLFDIWHNEKHEAVRKAFTEHKYLEKNEPCLTCSYGVITEKATIKVGHGLDVRKYKNIPPVVLGDYVQLKAPNPAKPRKKSKMD